MLETAIRLKVKQDEDGGMDVEETFGDGISAPASPLPESEVGTGGLGDAEDEGALPIEEEGNPLEGGDEAEEW